MGTLCRQAATAPTGRARLALVLVLDLALGGLLERHRQVVLRARLDERGQELVECPLAELVVVVVDLPGPLGRDDHQRVARVDVLEQFIDARVDQGAGMVPAAANSARTRPSSSPIARSRSSFTIVFVNSGASLRCSSADSSRCSISPSLSVPRARRRRSSSASLGAVMKKLMLFGSRSLTASAPPVSSSSRTG